MRKAKYILLAMTVGLLLSCGKQEQVSSFEETGEIRVNDYKKYKIEKLFSVEGITVYSFWDKGRRVYFTKNNIFHIQKRVTRVGNMFKYSEEAAQTVAAAEPDTLNINGLNYVLVR